MPLIQFFVPVENSTTGEMREVGFRESMRHAIAALYAALKRPETYTILTRRIHPKDFVIFLYLVCTEYFFTAFAYLYLQDLETERVAPGVWLCISDGIERKGLNASHEN